MFLEIFKNHPNMKLLMSSSCTYLITVSNFNLLTRSSYQSFSPQIQHRQQIVAIPLG